MLSQEPLQQTVKGGSTAARLTHGTYKAYRKEFLELGLRYVTYQQSVPANFQFSSEGGAPRTCTKSLAGPLTGAEPQRGEEHCG